MEEDVAKKHPVHTFTMTQTQAGRDESQTAHRSPEDAEAEPAGNLLNRAAAADDPGLQS